MKSSQMQFVKGKWVPLGGSEFISPQLVLAFGATALVGDAAVYAHLHQTFPQSNIVLASTSGEILGDGLFDDTVAVTALEFEKTEIKCVSTLYSGHKSSFEVGEYLMRQLLSEDLAAVMVISEGSFINGSELVSGLNKHRPANVPITGGLAGDAARFQQTLVGLNEVAATGRVVAIGFYGTAISVGHSSVGGWGEFGRERVVTQSEKNVLLELDGQSALDLYKEYLGPFVDELPGSALLFPLSITIEEGGANLVRTILSINEGDKSMTFAGNVPVGSKVRLMKANFDNLIEASASAAKEALEGILLDSNKFALLISCVGRKLVLQERTSEEVEVAKALLGPHSTVTGFYSYGEISPSGSFSTCANCELHNQTMTITVLSERV